MFVVFVFLLDIFKWVYISGALETNIYTEERIKAAYFLQIDFLGAAQDISAIILVVAQNCDVFWMD